MSRTTTHCGKWHVSDTTGEWVGNMQGVPGTQSSTASTAMDTDRQVQPLTAPEACQTMQPVLLRDSTMPNGIKAEPVSFIDAGATKCWSVTDTGPSNSTAREPACGADVLLNRCNNLTADTGCPKNTASNSLTDTNVLQTVKCEPITSADTWTVIKFEPLPDTDSCAENEIVTDKDTWATIKSEPFTDADRWTNIKSEPVSDSDTWSSSKTEADTDTNTATTIQPMDDPAVVKTDTAVSMESLPPREGQERLPSEPQPADKEVSHNA